jgi:hypothetical protein
MITVCPDIKDELQLITRFSFQIILVRIDLTDSFFLRNEPARSNKKVHCLYKISMVTYSKFIIGTTILLQPFLKYRTTLYSSTMISLLSTITIQ